jgi:hypothetical protein
VPTASMSSNRGARSAKQKPVRRLLLGNQEPRVFTAPAYTSSTGPEAIDLARMAGLDLDIWQQKDLTAALGERNGKWAAFEVAKSVPRQVGKSTELRARQLTGLYLIEERLQVHTAHLADTVQEQRIGLEELIEGTPELSRRTKKITHGKGDEYIQLHRHRRTGKAPRLRFRTRAHGGGRGFSGDTVYLDEAMILSRAFHGMLMPVLRAQPNPQLWYAGSPVDQEEHEHGLVFASVRQRGIAGTDPSLVYLEFSLPFEDIADLTDEAMDDPEMWALVTPPLGTRVSADFIAAERRAMGRRQFAAECLGVGSWPDPTEGAGSVITGEMWKPLACGDESHRILGEKTFALDVSPARTWGAIGVSGVHPGERWHVAVVKHQRKTNWIVPACKQLQEEHPESSFAFDVGGPVGKSNIPEELSNAGVRLIEADTTDYAQACAGFYDAVDNDTLRYPAGEGALSEAVADARTQPMGDGWKWSRRNSTSADITPLVSTSLALWAAQTQVGGYTTVIFPDTPETASDDSTPVPQRVIEAEDTYDCFACRTGSCEVHG